MRRVALDSVHLGHPDVHDDHVGAPRAHQLEGLGSSRSLATTSRSDQSKPSTIRPMRIRRRSRHGSHLASRAAGGVGIGPRAVRLIALCPRGCGSGLEGVRLACPSGRWFRVEERGVLMLPFRDLVVRTSVRRMSRGAWKVGAAAATAAVLVAVIAGSAGAAGSRSRGAVRADTTGSCQLGNGVKHVIDLTFDNVHFYRDNPNVPSDLELMPNLLDFFERNGTMMSNSHTPLIAHTADDILTTLTGLYGDRHGMPISNDYQSYNANGSTDSASSFAYWTDPIFDTSSHPNPGHDTNPSMVYSRTPPATTSPPPPPNTITPAPWVPFTRTGCNVGDVSTANVELENTGVDIPKVFGPNSPEAKQLAADKDPFKDTETADYVGVAVHCSHGQAFCKKAMGVKFGQSKPSHTAVADLLPNEPGGYTGFQALFGHRYVAPQLGAGTPNLMHNGFRVTNSKGLLVDHNGNALDGAFLNHHPGFPGFGDINASQTLAYMADMLESGVPVVQGYISDLHGNHFIPGLSACNSAPAALGSGSACYIQQAQYYNAAFGRFFKRLAADGIT